MKAKGESNITRQRLIKVLQSALFRHPSMSRFAEIAPLDVLLMMSGSRLNTQLFNRRRLGSLCNMTFRLLFLICMTRHFFDEIRDSITKGKLPAYGLTTIAMTFLSGLSMLMFGLRLKTIRRFARDRLVSAAETSLEEIRKMASRALIAALSVIASDIINGCINGYAMNATVGHTISGTLWFLPITVNAFHITFPTFYVIMLRLLTNQEVSCMSDMIHQVSKGLATPSRLMSQRQQLMSVRHDLEQLFSYIPAILFAVPFFAVPEMVTTISKHFASKPMLVAYADLVYYIIVDGVTFAVLLLFVRDVTRGQSRMRKASQQLIQGRCSGCYRCRLWLTQVLHAAAESASEHQREL